MKFNKPKFWDNNYYLIPYLLLPITFLISLLIFLKKKFTKPIKFNSFVICVGNIYVGGTGKTPTSILLYNELLKLKKNPVIIRKFYKDHNDEYNLINKSVNSLIHNQSRLNAIRDAEKKNHNPVILDDGFQDYKINKDLSIICFNQNQLVGNGLTLPSGPLRESLNSLKRAHIVLINGKKNFEFEKKILKINPKLNIFYSKYIPNNINEFINKKLLAIAGIGNPSNFFDLLEKNDLTIAKKIVYPDHHEFSEEEINSISKLAEENNYQIILTEKDFYKIKNPDNKTFKYLDITLEIAEKQKLINLVLKAYDKNY